jgi:hypothetical protein
MATAERSGEQDCQGPQRPEDLQTYWMTAGRADMDAIGQRPPLNGKVRKP